jgi:hypothetical protein
MNKILLCLSFLVFTLTATAQRVYFIYIQTEQEQPFFIKMNEKVHSSTVSGYLILSKLRDSTYNFTIGFPNDKWGEQKFSVAVKGKDQGFLLKNFGEKGWGLFNLQTLSVQMAAGEKTSGIRTEKMAEVSPFTEILARAADDSTLRERPIIVKAEEKKPVVEIAKTTPDAPPVITRSPEIKKDEPIIVKDTEITRQAEEAVVRTAQPNTTPKENITVTKEEPKEEIKAPPLVQEQPKEMPYKRSVVTRHSESSTADGLSLTFIDESYNGTKDTIQITIPPARPVVAEVKETPKEERKFLDITSNKKEDDQPAKQSTDTIKPVATTTEAPSVTEPPVTITKPRSNNCKEQAVEKDFLALRKKMAAENDDDDMVDQARQYFRKKCFTTAQVKNLSVLFLDDLGKYKFLEAAYFFVSDKESYPALQSELKNDYYINRFKTLLNQ